MKNELANIIAVIGPTASGKSDLAVELALKNNGEVVSVDSRQVYKNLDIGTGKITEKETKGVKHHMLSVYDISEDISVAKFVEDTLPIIEDILNRKKIPILCGGSGQYMYALIYKQEFPKILSNKNIRNELENLSTEELFSKLEKLDKTRSEKIDKNNRVRLIRALEILLSGGIIKDNSNPKKRFNVTFYNTEIDRKKLKENIANRLEKRLKEGMLDEGKKVFELNLSDHEIKRLGIEYFAMCKYFKKEINEEEMKDLIKRESYKYAKRQMMWNKKYFPIKN